MSPQEKQALKTEKEAVEAKYKFAIVDGRKEQVCSTTGTAMCADSLLTARHVGSRQCSSFARSSAFYHGNFK